MYYSLSCEIDSHSAGQEIPRLFGAKRYVTALTRAATGRYPQPVRSRPKPVTLFLWDSLSYIHPSRCRSRMWSLPFSLPALWPSSDDKLNTTWVYTRMRQGHVNNYVII